MSKLESKLEFGTEPVPADVFFNNELGQSASKIVAERRAYAIFTSTGEGVCGATAGRIESKIVTSNSYESILSGPRLVPPPSLTSIDWSSDGANDIYDGYLWKATVSFTCYSPEQFDSFDISFFQHFNKVKLTLGWLTGNETNSVTINGTIIDYQFSINEKLHYDCSVTFTGLPIEASTAFDLNLKESNTTTQLGTLQLKPQSIIGALKARAMTEFPKVPDGTHAHGDASYGVAKFKLNTTSWIFFKEDKEVYYVSLSKLIETINDNLVKLNGFEGIFKNIESATRVTTKIKSANPVSVLNQGSGGESANYAVGANFRWDGSGVMYFISFDTLEKIQKELIDDKSDNPHPTKNTLIQFIKRVLDEINSCLGESIKLEMIPYGQSGKSTKHGYEIVDRKTFIKKINATDANPLDVKSTIRNISVQSTIDSEIASIALSAAQSGKNQGVVQGVFGCKPALPKVEEDKNQLLTMYQSFVELDETIIGDCVQTLKKICNTELPQMIGYKYGVTITITVDGYPSHLFGKVFKVKGLPSMLTKANVYFIVLKQGHKFSNGDWTMDLEGQMMFDISDGAKPNEGFDPIAGAVAIPPPTRSESRTAEEAAPAAGGISNSL
jgi:hypothetical protein